MKLSSILCASLMGLVALALTFEGAAATPRFSVNASRFDPYKLKANDPKGETDCAAKGGKVVTDKEGTKTCKDVQDNAVADTGKTAKPSSGEKAGVTARTDGSRGVWKAPAGIEAQKNSDAARSSEPEWKYVPVRRLAQKLEQSLYRKTQWVVFEPNDEPLWAQIRLKIGDYMMSLYRQGIFQGKAPKDAFFVKCDKSTTTQDDIDHGIVNILVGFAPLKPAEFEVIKIRQQTLAKK